MAKFQSNPRCPKTFGAGKVEKVSYIVMQLLGKNLSELRRTCKLSPQRLSVSTAHRLMVQCLDALEALHHLGFLHRDLKPSNFAMGGDKSNRNRVFMLDYGMARYYVSKTGVHRPYQENVDFRGTVRYASINAHEYKEQSRRDDLWSMFYSHYELLVGQLPWRKSNDNEVVLEAKKEMTPEKLAEKLPVEAVEFVKEIPVLGFTDPPAYIRITESFNKALTRFGVNADDPFDWQVPDCRALKHWDKTSRTAT